MGDGAQFPFSRLGRTRKAKPSEFTQALRLCPVSGFILEIASGNILEVNPHAEELSGYAAEELQGINIQAIIPELDIYSLDKSANSISPLILQRKDTSIITIQVDAWEKSADNKSLVLFFSPVQGGQVVQNLDVETLRLSDVRELLETLQEQPDLDSAFSKLFAITQTSLLADCLAIYCADQDLRNYSYLYHHGRWEWLPEQLAGHEAALLHSPQVWQSNKRPTNPISRAAREARLAFGACFPIIFDRTLRGFLILAGNNTPNLEKIEHFGVIYSQVIAQIIKQSDLYAKVEVIEKSLESTLQLNTNLKDNILEGCLVIDNVLSIIEINAAAARILGYGRNQVIGQPIEKVLIGTETLNAALEFLRNNSGKLKPTELRLYRRSGEAFLAQIQAFPLNNPSRQNPPGTVEGFPGSLIIFQDLSQQENAREQARQLEQRAMLGEVTAVFAHEVRNPINNISTGLELIAINLPDEDQNQATIARLLQDCDRLAELMKSVLSFSRPAEYTMSVLNLEPFLQNLLERMRPRLERMNVQGNLQAEANLGPVIGSPRALEQVFSNLINNALQAMGENGGQVIIKIQRPQSFEGVSTNENDRFVEVCVIDTGPGIPQEYQERLFQPFFTTNTHGTGLGLAIAKRIITAHRGSISVNSFPGGTVFHILLPKAVQT